MLTPLRPMGMMSAMAIDLYENALIEFVLLARPRRLRLHPDLFDALFFKYKRPAIRTLHEGYDRYSYEFFGVPCERRPS